VEERGTDREAMIALAALPAGALLALGSAVAAVVLGFLALIGVIWAAAGDGRWWFVLWTVAAAIVATRNTVAAIEVMSALAWRPVLSILLLWAAVIAIFPGWW
jgi:hypothetical protein